MQDFEKLGVFYLGRDWDAARAAVSEDLVLYDARNLTTHAVCVGMTGSGKTGLCIGMIEEAAIDGIPALVIDPKGDLANLLLTFPELRPEDFQTWVDPGEAQRRGISIEELARLESERWSKGLVDSGQDGARIQRMRDAAEFVVFTPGARAGVPVSVMRSFAAPPAEVRADADLLRERAGTTATSLLGLLGVDADPLRSREHILLSTLLIQEWEQGRDLDLVQLVPAIRTPPLTRVGALDLESFYPAKERFELAMKLNNVLASPTFEAWREGEPLEVGSLLYGPSGKPRVAIFSIAHLSDAERMFFVSLLLQQTLAWMRAQPGTSSLRAIVYMDEIFGYLPPTANPPSKTPFLTLLKQARAYGVGVVLATQNPVDLDYKGLANAGTWFIGKLQTERDRLRLLDGLQSAGGSVDRAEIERWLDGLGKRVFLLHDVRETAPRAFQTRWTLSYLRGPLTRDEIKKLRGPSPAGPAKPAAAAPVPPPAAAAPGASSAAPILPPGIPQTFFRAKAAGDSAAPRYVPMLLGAATMRFADKKNGIDLARKLSLLAVFPASTGAAAWTGAREVLADLEERPALEPGVEWAPLPPEATQARSYARWMKELVGHLYREQPLQLLRSARLAITSQPGESERDFRIRLRDRAHEQRDQTAEALRAKYRPKLERLEDAVRRSEHARAREGEQLQQQKAQNAISVGATILGAFVGGRRSALGRASTAARGLGRTRKEAADVERADANLDAAQAKLQALDAEFQQELAALSSEFDADREPLETLSVRARKVDIAVQSVSLAWVPSTAVPSS